MEKDYMVTVYSIDKSEDIYHAESAEEAKAKAMEVMREFILPLPDSKEVQFLSVAVPLDPDEKKKLTPAAKKRFGEFRSAFADFCLDWDTCEDMAQGIMASFDRDIRPFDPYELFHWQPLHVSEIQSDIGHREPAFSGELIDENVTLIARKELNLSSYDAFSMIADGAELWLTDEFEFFLTRYTEIRELDRSKTPRVSMLCRSKSDEDPGNVMGGFHTEDFYELLQQKIRCEQ